MPRPYEESTWLAVLDGIESIYNEARHPMNAHATIHALRAMHDHYAEGMSLTGAVAKHYERLRRQLGLTSPSAPVTAASDTWPRRGLSFYTSATDPRLDIGGFAARLRDAGAGYTRVWMLDAWAIGGGGTGCYDGYLPWLRSGDGRFDLWAVDEAYLERLRDYVEAMNAVGVLPQLSGLDLYTWSNRKQGMLWVPPMHVQPFRNNRQGICYSDDSAFDRIGQRAGQDAFLGHFYGRVVEALDGLVWAVEVANEMPQKEMHVRLRDLWRLAGFTGSISVNRHEDTPGQFANMKIGREYDRIAYHGKRDMGYLDEVYPDEPVHKTFRAFYASEPEPSRIILSSDGCRKPGDPNPDDAYDYPALEEVFKDALERGFSVEHQSRIKLRGFTEGRIDLNDLEVDWMRTFTG